ncbi:C40 family peptidase [Salimicrobium jeotgali]|uniref:C40 family peptidase n=1 Tax=Salimicrobium jeotgali TaxID=1230341 RepID=UPI000C814877|nr:C40 family peptidase [Salimicrobium jeotgali]
MIKRLAAFLFTFAAVFLLFAPGSSAQSKAESIIDTAYRYSGSPYVYGGTTPSGFDCSGFTRYVYAKNGVKLNRTSRQQARQGKYVSRSNLKPGDLVFFGKPVYHVGIYIGNDRMISAENSRDDIDVTSLNYNYWKRNYSGARRVFEEDQSHTSSNTITDFRDVPDHYWAAKKISYISDKGIIEGYNGYFRPKDNVTRGEAAKMISEALNLGTSSRDRFSDLSGWSRKYVNAVAAKGLIEGYEDGTYRPEEHMTREEIATVLTRAFDLSGSGRVGFKDVSSHNWSYEYIQALASNSITNGYEDNTFRPKKTTSRSEFAAFVYNAIN